MQKKDNYLLQVQQAQKYFLRYDQDALIRKLHLSADPEYLYAEMLCKSYRIRRSTGVVQRKDADWIDTTDHSEVMTLLDLVCDSAENRYLSLRWRQMQSFGLMFHQNLLENQPDPFAQRIQMDTAAFRRACLALRGEPMPEGDLAYAIELFDGLCICIQFWAGDEEFAPRIRYLWDENALMYIKYETMYFAVGLLRRRILEEMDK